MKLSENFQTSANQLKEVVKFNNVFSEDYYRFKLMGKIVNGQRFPDLSESEVLKIKQDLKILKTKVNDFENQFK